VGKVATGLSISLDGFIAGPNDGPGSPLGDGGARLFACTVEQARAVAGDKDVAVVGAASIAQQCIRAGLLDEIHVDLVPVLLGDGVRLFDHLGTGPIELESTRVVEGTGVTHLTFRVVM
jgi:dihydrofolate reductase